MKSNMKLFVWDEFCPDYSDGLAFAIARTEEEARDLVRKEHEVDVEPTWGNLKVFRIDRRVAKCCCGSA